MTVRDVYRRVCTRFLEPAGLQSGIFTESDFLNHFAGTITDWMERTGTQQLIVTGAVHFFISVYQVPDQISHVENVFVSGRLLRRTDLQQINLSTYQWRKQSGIPTYFLEDGLPAKQVQFYPKPDYEGSPIPTSGDGVIQPPETDEYMIVGGFYPTWRDYTLVGRQVPLAADLTPKLTWTLDDPITGIPRSAMPYLAWGVLTKMYSDDSEAKDQVRARYCSGRFEEGISIFQTILAERCFDDPDAAL